MIYDKPRKEGGKTGSQGNVNLHEGRDDSIWVIAKMLLLINEWISFELWLEAHELIGPSFGNYTQTILS